PAGLHWVPLDFRTQDLAAAVKRSPYDPLKRTFFSWLGVTYYLERAQVLATLRAMAGLAPSGSPIIFDYMDADMFVPGHASVLMERVQAIVRTAGEPMKTGFDPSTLRSELAAAGLELIEDLGPDEIQARYFSARTDGYHALEKTHFVRAAVVKSS
ncbi:MAG TPA: class I SAM-dependent methyltransferase, partial [Anaerolineae bacterium]